MNKEKTKTIADDIYRALLLQWELLGRTDVIVQLVITADNKWGLYEAKRLNCSEADSAVLSSLNDGDKDDKQNYFG